MTFIICSLWLPQPGSPQAATPGKLYTVQFSFSGFHSAFAPFTNSILINSQAIYIAKTTKSRWLSSSALSGSHSQARRKRPRRENCTLYSFLFPAFTPLLLRSPTPSWLTVKLYTNHKFVKANKKAGDFHHLLSLAPTVGLEPTTSWLTVKRSTDWAMREYLILF